MAADSSILRVGVLGPIAAVGPDGEDLTPVGDLQRRLLALLVLERGRVVTVDSAIDVLWPSERPLNPVSALQNHLFRLRRSLPGGVIESVGDGYRLDPALIDLDCDRLTVALSRTATDVRASEVELDRLLDRWSGPAFPELADHDAGRIEADRLEELRSQARERRAELQVARGDLDRAIADLTVLVRDEPLREAPRALLMTALAAAGRHADALRTYDDLRRRLGEELGIEPSPALTAQHDRLLLGEEDTWVPPSRLPVPTTSLIGRDDLAAHIHALAEQQSLVTLVGPGGVGKTRLLIELGHRLRTGAPEHPVVLCELASADTASALDHAAAALGIDSRRGVSPADRLVDVVGDAALVLLLDNCEHVLDPIAELVDRILAKCPNVTVVATSRERLRLPGEQVVTVPPLEAGDGSAPAVQLFVERAAAVVPGFQPDPRELDRIEEVARRLDGLPLAIELAAARLHTHELSELSAGLDDRFTLLSAGYRSSSRHGSLSAVIDWSYGLLDPTLQQVLANLSVFTGRFTADDAASVCEMGKPAVSSALVQLVERSLLMRGAGGRYRMLETLRAFGAEQLAATARADATAERHARHQVEWIERASRGLVTGQSSLDDIDSALPELRAAMTWLVDHDRFDDAGLLVANLLDYGFLRLRPDVLGWAFQVTEADPEADGPGAAHAQVAASYAAWMSGDLAASKEHSRLALRAGGGSAPVPPRVMAIQGSIALFEGDLSEALTWYSQGVDTADVATGERQFIGATRLLALGYAGDERTNELADQLLQEAGDAVQPFAAYAWYCAGEAVMAQDVDLAVVRFQRALELADATSASFITGLAGASKASIDARRGEPEAAAAEYRRLIDHWRRAGMWSTQWTMLRSIAGLLARLGHHRDAAVLEGAVRATEAGHRIFGADAVALDELGDRLRRELGGAEYAAAVAEGAALDGDAAVEHALRCL